MASAALEGRRYPLDEVRAGTVTDPVVQGALRVSREVDSIAIGFVRFNPRCKFSPAIGKDGKPVAYVIESYVVRFENE